MANLAYYVKLDHRGLKKDTLVMDRTKQQPNKKKVFF